MPGFSLRGRVSLPVLFGMAAMLALVPVLLVPIPGFVDAPAHLARHHILAVAPLGGALMRHYAVHWQWIGNLGEDIPAALLGRWLGAETATRLLTALIAPLTIAGMAALSRAVHGRIAASAFLALPLALNQAWAFGFLNYGLGTALALLTAAWLLARQRETVAGALGLGLAALVVWTAHMASWAILLVIAAGSELVRLRSLQGLWPAVRRNLPLLAPLIPLLAWRAHAGGSDFSWVYDDLLPNKLVVFASALRGTWMALDMGLLATLVLCTVLALRWAGGSAGGRQVEPRLFAGALLLVVAAIAAPEYLLGSWGTDVRTAPIALMVFILAIGPAADPKRERLLCAIGLALFAVRLGSVTWAWAQRSPELESRLAMLDAVPRGGRLGYLWVPPACNRWPLQPDEKLASYAVTRRDAFVNTLFMVDNARLVTLRDPQLQARWTSDSQTIDRLCPGDRLNTASLRLSLEALRQDRFDAIWVSGVRREALPQVPGYAVARGRPGETLLVRR